MLFIEEIRLIWLKSGTKEYAEAYFESGLKKAQAAKDGLYHFLLVVFT